MSDVQNQWEAAIHRNDMVEAFAVMLSIQPNLTADKVHRALTSLCPHVEPGAIPALANQLEALGQAIGAEAPIPRQAFEAGPRRFAVDDRIADVPNTLEQALGTLSAEGATAALCDHDEFVAAFAEHNPDGGRQWYLRTLAAPGDLLDKVAQIPQWMAAVHSPRELSQIAQLISQTVRMTEPAS